MGVLYVCGLVLSGFGAGEDGRLVGVGDSAPGGMRAGSAHFSAVLGVVVMSTVLLFWWLLLLLELGLVLQLILLLLLMIVVFL